MNPKSNIIAHSTLSISSCTTNKGNQGIQLRLRLLIRPFFVCKILVKREGLKGNDEYSATLLPLNPSFFVYKILDKRESMGLKGNDEFPLENAHQIVCEKRQLNHILVHFVKYRDILAQKRQHAVFINFVQTRCKFDE